MQGLYLQHIKKMQKKMKNKLLQLLDMFYKDILKIKHLNEV